LLLGAALQNNKTVLNGSTSRLASPDADVTFAPQPSSLSPGENKYRQFWAEMTWDAGFAQLTYLPAYRTWTSDTIIFQRPNPTPGVPVGAFDQYSTTDKDDFWTHELRLASKADSKLAWQVGAFYYDNALHNNNYFIRQPSGGFYRGQNISRDTTAWSGFAEGTYPFTDATRVTAGLRFDKTTVQVNEDFTNNPNCITTIPGGVDSTLYCIGSLPMVHGILSGNAGKRVFNEWTYKLRLEHDFTPENMAYAMVSTGVSPGDITLAVDLRPTIVVNGATVTNPDYQKPVAKEITSETLTSYEIGSKNRFLDNRLQVNADVFYYDYGAYTVANANVNGSVVNGVFVAIPTPTQFETLSAPLKTYGLELETLFQLTPHDRIALNYAYTHTQFTDKNRPVPGTQATFGDFFGLDEVAGAVPHRASLSYNHGFDLPGGSKLSAGAATRWLSAFTSSGLTKSQVNTVYAAVWPWIRTKGEFVTDLNVNWTSPAGMFSVNGWVRNVFNNQSKQSATVLNVNATNVANGTAFTNIGGSTFDPRTYGVVFNVKW
jgi:iron complex outermembrane receptor protein